ncbi:MAG: DUF5946 family protein [Chloroflexota bacterium]|nr:DUF5946 family protein [Chloroflexota bacterium]
MRCAECGADLPGAETCEGRFHALLAAEVENEELARMHGLTVLTYQLQHPSRTKPRYQEFGAGVMHRAFGGGEDWTEALAAVAGRPGGYDRDRNRWRQVGPQKNWERALNERKAAAGAAMPPWVVATPIAGEVTVADVDPAAPAGQEGQVLAWARSVAAHRFLGDAGGGGATEDGEASRARNDGSSMRNDGWSIRHGGQGARDAGGSLRPVGGVVCGRRRVDSQGRSNLGGEA